MRTMRLSALPLLLLLAAGSGCSSEAATEDPAAVEAAEREKKSLQKQLRALQPKGYYILIDTAANKLYVKKGDKLVREALCSTGSGRRLVSAQRSWTFETPRGEFRILGKANDPVWRKPDWAFLEEGQAVPVREQDRFEEGVLGDYALSLGDGYFIHGTLYTRMLGKNVTHGCIRLGDDDLEFVSRTVPVGAPVLIF